MHGPPPEAEGVESEAVEGEDDGDDVGDDTGGGSEVGDAEDHDDQEHVG